MPTDIYGRRKGVTQEQSPLAAFLASSGPAAQHARGGAVPSRAIPGGPPAAGYGGSPPDERPTVGQAGAATNPLGAGVAKQNLLGPDLGPDLPHMSFDYSGDPQFQAAMSGNAADDQDAEAQALGAQRSLLSQYGDRGLAATVLGSGDPTLGSISDDPSASTSTLARLKRSYADTVKQNEDSMNENNLFYGGQRAKRLGDLAKDESTQEGDASAQVHAALDQIAGGLSSTKKGLRDKAAAAESDAANRKIQELLAQIMAGGGGGGGGGGITPKMPGPGIAEGTIPNSGGPVQASLLPFVKAPGNRVPVA